MTKFRLWHLLWSFTTSLRQPYDAGFTHENKFKKLLARKCSTERERSYLIPANFREKFVTSLMHMAHYVLWHNVQVFLETPGMEI